jgi:PilZ domain-containing protein
MLSQVPLLNSQPSAESGDGSSPNELRAAQRLPASAVPAITGLRIQGQKATLINISETGLLAECGERQMPGSRLTVMVEGAFAPATMRCRVTRTSVAALGADGRLRYHVGVQFDSRITLEDAPPPAVTAAKVATVQPAAAAAPPVAAAPESIVRNRW